MEPQELAQWLQKEHERVEDLARLLRTELAAIPRTNVDQWLTGLRDRFEHIRAHYQKHMALEEHEGYLTEVLERRPTLSADVGRLQHEHGELANVMDGIHHVLKALQADDRLLIRDCCRRIEGFLVELERHDGDENLLVLSVFARDIGSEG